MTSPSMMRHGKTIAVIAAMLTLAASAANAASGPFARMAGTWFGDGRVILADGEVERIRCRASDDVGDSGDVMRQHLRCASASYSFDVQNAVSYRGGRVTGNWDETTRNIGGQVFGVASPNLVRARVEGGQFAADVTLAPKGNSLDVTLVPHGSDVREVAVALRRT
jgi:hypothetical protein